MSNKDFENVDLSMLEPLLEDPNITEIMVNGTEAVYVEKAGKLIKTDVRFETEDEVLNVIQAIVGAIGREINERTPIVDARLPDGSRVNAVIRPVALVGPTLTLRKMAYGRHLTWENVLEYGSLDERVFAFLQACVRAKRNIVVSGGTASGKTTILNLLSELIPDDERIVTAEVMAELMLRHPHVVGMETRPADGDGKGEVTITELIVNAQRMRPNRIISGEVQGGEAWDMLKVMTMGYDGSMFTIHATNTQDAIERLEMMCTQASNLPLLQIRATIAQGIDIITQQNLLDPAGRRIVTIAEVLGLRNNVIETQDIFRFVPTGVADGKVVGEFRLTGYVPTFADQLRLGEGYFEG